MKRIFLAISLVAALSLHAAAPPRGNDRLRELVVFPEMNVGITFYLYFQGNKWVVSENLNLPDEISRVREELKQQPNDIKQLLRMGNLLESNGETNESQSYYQKAEPLCRNKAVANPQDGLSLNDLGEALWELGKHDEAESVYRKATLVSSNEWRCWIGLGNFLANEDFFLMFPENLRGQAVPSCQMPSQEVLDYRPSADALTKSETSLIEASRCFDRAMRLSPQESEVFFQRAGYLCSSNWQNCFFRHFRDNEKIEFAAWLTAFCSKESIANLQKAAELSPKKYEYISFAAYFEWVNATKQADITNITFTFNTLPDTTRQSIHDAMTRLENLSEDSDKKTAAGALQNLGMLNVLFGNSPAAATELRRAVSLDPTREQSWDLLLGSLVDSASPDELVTICESRLKYKDSARNHLLLAKILTNQKKWDKATEQAEIADKLATNNIVSPLLIAAIALKQSDQTNYLSVAKINLNRAFIFLQNTPTSQARATHWREFMLDGAILSALNNEPQFAIDWVNRVLKYFPNDEQAKEILAALN
jgi:tetratricopeptide (TPR) repeat protein